MFTIDALGTKASSISPFPLLIGLAANALFWWGSFQPFDGGGDGALLNAALVLTAMALAGVGWSLSVLHCPERFSLCALGGQAANSAVFLAMALMAWGVVG
ncbi:MAG: hypothetical protein HQL36_04630 [Alphaproteobacteria bacterium]|nr:hypothetical protein [Alphaproteobacteria bacterium]MBF0250749.1 hypothetical protein [Alphaproteobacteria bacterium]